MEVEVIEIYPFEEEHIKKLQLHIKKKIKEAGTVHAYINDFKLNIKNIRYTVFKNNFINIMAPGRNQFCNEEKIFVPTITWDDPEIWREIRDKTREEIKKNC